MYTVHTDYGERTATTEASARKMLIALGGGEVSDEEGAVICAITRDQIRRANAIARKAGYATATDIRMGEQTRVVSHVPYGYRKKSTGQYVPNAYRSNFGWKNTYYQRAETVVEIAANE